MTTDLPTFAAAVRSACLATPRAGRVGGFAPRVWIHAAWAVGRFPETLAEFKRRCVEANRAGLLRLSRCDMPEAFDAYDVGRSEAVDRGATYNLIRA
jgi:hypothetical protein